MEYFISVDGEAQGPFSVEDLSNLYTAGNINETSMIWYEGLETWVNLSELPLYEEIKTAVTAAEIQQNTPAESTEYTGKLKINLVNPISKPKLKKLKNNNTGTGETATKSTADTTDETEPPTPKSIRKGNNSQKRYFWGRFYIKVIYAVCIFYCIIALLLGYFFIETANTAREKARQNNKMPSSEKEKILQKQKDAFANYSKTLNLLTQSKNYTDEALAKNIKITGFRIPHTYLSPNVFFSSSLNSVEAIDKSLATADTLKKNIDSCKEIFRKELIYLLENMARKLNSKVLNAELKKNKSLTMQFASGIDFYDNQGTIKNAIKEINDFDKDRHNIASKKDSSLDDEKRKFKQLINDFSVSNDLTKIVLYTSFIEKFLISKNINASMKSKNATSEMQKNGSWADSRFEVLYHSILDLNEGWKICSQLDKLYNELKIYKEDYIDKDKNLKTELKAINLLLFFKLLFLFVCLFFICIANLLIASALQAYFDIAENSFSWRKIGSGKED